MKTELLNKLSPDAIDLSRVGGGWASLTPQDVAAALAGLPPPIFNLAMAVYVADAIAYQRLYYAVCELDGIPRKPQELKGKSIRPVEGILLLCLDELWGNNKCQTCFGAGVNENQQPCAVCRERKLKVYTDLSRSKQAGIPVEYWPVYKGFYQRLYTTMSDWDCQIRTHLAKRLEV